MTPTNGEKLDAIMEKVDEMREWQRHHLVDYHANLKVGETAVLIEQNRSNASQVKHITTELDRRAEIIDMLVEDVEGRVVYDPVTGVMIDRQPSLRKLIEEIYEQGEQAVRVADGDVTLSFTSKVSVAIITAVIAGAAVVIGAIVEGLLK